MPPPSQFAMLLLIVLPLKVAWPNAPRWLSVALYLATGWIALVAVGQLASWFALIPALLLIGGGVLYSAGALITNGGVGASTCLR